MNVLDIVYKTMQTTIDMRKKNEGILESEMQKNKGSRPFGIQHQVLNFTK